MISLQVERYQVPILNRRIEPSSRTCINPRERAGGSGEYNKSRIGGPRADTGIAGRRARGGDLYLRILVDHRSRLRNSSSRSK
jgi:hypothetical protein